MDINYSQLEKEILENLGNKAVLVVATSKDNRVTARSLSCIINDKKIYFQTDKNFIKYQQIISNPKVALCINNIQIEGIATPIGHPLENKNAWFKKLYKEYYPQSFDNYSKMKNEVIIEVNPTYITLWKYIDNKPLRDYLDLINKKAQREYYNI